MSGNIASDTRIDWRGKLRTLIVFFAIGVLPLLAHAGGLGIAPLAAIVGGVGLLTSSPRALLRIPKWFWPLFLFLLWAVFTSLWSPYEDTLTLTNPVKIIIGVMLFLGCFLTFQNVPERRKTYVRHSIVATAVFSMGILIIDSVSGYALTFLADPLKEGENIIRKGGEAEMNLGHGITVLVLLMPLVMMLLARNARFGKYFALMFAIGVFVTAFVGHLMVGILAATGALLSMFAARKYPVGTIKVITWVAVLSILGAPFFGYLFGFASPEFKASLPFSWEHRVEMWSYTAAQILEAPFWGHGFDAVRTFDGTFSSRGIESWSIVSLHPHNAGLHIWAETGLVGAALAAVTLLMMGLAAERLAKQSPEQAIAMAGFFAAATIIAAITYGVWQDWWWATLIFASALQSLLAPDKA